MADALDRAPAGVAEGERARSGKPAGVVFGALGVAVLAMLLLHLRGAGRLDPATTTVSDYVSVPDGTALLAVSVLAVAIATAAVPIALFRAGLPGSTRLYLPFGLGCAGLLASIAFPTNAVGTAVSTDTVLHRYAAGLFFVSLPVAAILTLRRLPDLAVRRLTRTGALAGIAFVLSHVPLLLPGWPGAHTIAVLLPRGLAERLLLIVDLVLLGALARSARRSVR